VTSRNDITGDLITSKFSRAFKENFDRIFRQPNISSDDIPENLSLLPEDSVWRNTPLMEIGAFYNPRGTKTWREVLPTFPISKVTFNQLGDAWLHDTWKATKHPNGK